MPQALRVGLTGGLASGKSTVAAWLGEAGFRVVDADALVADSYRPGGAGARRVADLFGPGFLRPDGGVDKVAVARLVFRDAAARERLEEAIHPLVRQAFAEIAGAADGVVVLEATRLVEAGFGPDFDLVVTVESPKEMRLERAVARGMSRPEAIARLEAQGDGEERRRRADYLLSNDGDLARLRDETAELVALVRRRAAARSEPDSETR
ncbi:MAG: dephospho-CoA kinase [Thermoanaerobaculia bacterium]